MVNEYDVYDELCKYWEETLQDDAYMVSRDGWQVTIELPKDKKGNVKKSYTYADIACDLFPCMVLIKSRMPELLKTIHDLDAQIEQEKTDMDDIVEQNEGTFTNEKGDLMNVKTIKAIVKTAKKEPNICSEEDLGIYNAYIELSDELADLKKKLKNAITKLTIAVQEKYKTLTPEEIREIVFIHKWMPAMRSRLESLMQTAQLVISNEIHMLNTRYEHTLGELSNCVTENEQAVNDCLRTMGFII